MKEDANTYHHFKEGKRELMPRFFKSSVFLFSLFVLCFIAWMQKNSSAFSFPFETEFLPKIYSITNLIAGVLLLLGLYFIKRKEREKHRKCMTLALLLSIFFFIAYVLYHLTNTPQIYTGEGILRFIYFSLLLTHILSAILSLPLILLTFGYGYYNEISKHRSLAPSVFFLWLYVCFSGPLCYFFLHLQ